MTQGAFLSTPNSPLNLGWNKVEGAGPWNKVCKILNL